MQDGPDKLARPWWELMDALRAEQGNISLENLAFEARRYGASAGLTGSQLSKYRAGSRPLNQDLLRGIAGALGIEPEAFVEYRLMAARRLLDEKQVGLQQAAANLKALEDLLAESGVPGPPDGELARLLRDVSPSRPGQQRERSRDQARSARRRKAA